MAGPARYTALLDACVLFPLAMADALMSLATARLFEGWPGFAIFSPERGPTR